jgi:hypothetical protein
MVFMHKQDLRPALAGNPLSVIAAVSIRTAKKKKKKIPSSFL